jgi:hypothetical protein
MVKRLNSQNVRFFKCFLKVINEEELNCYDVVYLLDKKILSFDKYFSFYNELNLNTFTNSKLKVQKYSKEIPDIVVEKFRIVSSKTYKWAYLDPEEIFKFHIKENEAIQMIKYNILIYKFVADKSALDGCSVVGIKLTNSGQYNQHSERDVVFINSYKGYDNEESFKKFCNNICGLKKIGEYNYKEFLVDINGVIKKLWIIIFFASDIKCLCATSNVVLQSQFFHMCKVPFGEICEYQNHYAGYERRTNFTSIFIFDVFYIPLCLLHCCQRGSEKILTLSILDKSSLIKKLEGRIQTLLYDPSIRFNVGAQAETENDDNWGETNRDN